MKSVRRSLPASVSIKTSLTKSSEGHSCEFWRDAENIDPAFESEIFTRFLQLRERHSLHLLELTWQCVRHEWKAVVHRYPSGEHAPITLWGKKSSEVCLHVIEVLEATKP